MRKVITLSLLPCLSGYVFANQSPADLQQLERINAIEQQRQQQQAQQHEDQFNPQANVKFDKPKTAVLQLPTQKDDPCFNIKQINVVDHGVDGMSQFYWAYQQAVKELDLTLPYCFGNQSLNVLVTKIQNLIIDKGYITTRVVVEEQDLTKENLQLTVILGKVRHQIIEDSSAIPRFTRLNAWSAITLKQGDLLNVRDIEQSLENLKRLPTVDANINIVPAEGDNTQIGDSDLHIQYAQAFPFRLTLGLDDSGSTSTGRWQGSMTLSWDNLFKANDMFYTTFTHSMKRPNWIGQDNKGARSSENLSFYYSVPWRYWQISANYSDHQYHQEVAAAFGSTLLYSGKSRNSKISLSRLVFRNNQHKTYLIGALWTRHSYNYINDSEVDIQRKRTAGWEIGFSHRAYFGNRTLELGATYRRGTGANNAIRYPEERNNEGTSRMKIITANIAFTQPFSIGEQAFFYNTSWNAQWNKTPLVQQDRFSLGGRYTIRGTDGELTLSGERGWLWRNEFGWHIGRSGQQLYATYDQGIVRGQFTDELLGRSMSGVSLGLRGGYKNFNYDVFVGRPVHVPEGFRIKNKIIGFNLSASF